MNLGVIYNVELNNPECVIVHNYKNEEIGYVTYDEQLSYYIDMILKNKLYIETMFNNTINYTLCDKTSSYYLSALNNYLPFPYKVLWIKNVSGKIDDTLEEAQQLLNEKVYEKDEKIN